MLHNRWESDVQVRLGKSDAERLRRCKVLSRFINTAEFGYADYAARLGARVERPESPSVEDCCENNYAGYNCPHFQSLYCVGYWGDSPYPYAKFGLAWGCVMSVSAVGLWKGRAMDKILCYGSLGVAILMLLIFLLDLIAKTPFGGGPFVTVDVFGILASGIVVYLAWNASKDLK